jgi:hypothetical protein
MKRTSLAIVALALSATAHAADMPLLKAPANQWLNGYPATDGFYFGAYTQGGGGSAGVSAGAVPGLNSATLVTNQIGVGGLVGYAWNNMAGTAGVFVEGMFGWQNFNGNTVGFAFNGPAAFEQRVGFYSPLNALIGNLNLLPAGLVAPPFPPLPCGPTMVPAQPAIPATATSPGIPARPASWLPAIAGCTQTATNVNPYIMASISEQDISANFLATSANRDWRISPGVGVGALGHLTNGLVVDAWVEAKFPQKGFCLGNVGVLCGNVGTQYVVGLGFKY